MKKKALKVPQSKDIDLFIFSMNINEIEETCQVSRIFRDDSNKLMGYQRTEVKNHVGDIANYITQDGAIIPNSIIIGFNSRTTCREIDGEIFELDIPSGELTGVLVDGQQRVAALRESGRDDFHLSVCAFINDDVEFERQQFLLINSAKPLPRSLIYELLPHSTGVFKEELTRRRLPSLIVQLLNYDAKSPLQGVIKLTTNPHGIIADNSMMKMLDNSLREGALYDFRTPKSDKISASVCESMIDLLNQYYSSMREVFHEDWGKKPKDSRLFHGAGIIALGQIFDEVYYSYKTANSKESFFEFAVKKLRLIKPHCKWSEGYWDFGNDQNGEPIKKHWNQIQNLSNDIGLVTNHLVRVYDQIERGIVVAQSK
ncbi:tgtA5 cluster protein 1 [Vibrio variabilis]|uniref:TgtA5 cluster protein 1 n=1 Tax=Vibrio variabilis TaxID=990271 RepID=A0ABQ0JN46_9VIBR|nr:tgtA5 cluster protein 1 [Vibrio variabilis]